MGSCCTCSNASGPVDAATGDWVRLGIAGVVAAQSMIFGLAVNLSPPSGTARAVLHGALAVSAVAVFWLAGGRLLRNAWSAARSGRIVFDQLFLLGIVAAFGASVHCSLVGTGHVYYEIVAILLAIYTFGGLLTETQRNAALSAAKELGAEFGFCTVLGEGDRPERVAVDDVSRGDRVMVAAGGAIAVDGVVESGASFVREAALTGEPFPVVKRAGDLVRAGSHAIEGGLVVRSVCDGRARGLDDLLETLREARSRPCRLQREADRLATWFLPVVVSIAAATFAFWTARSGWEVGLFNALAVILVACPCAMGIATPVALWSSLSRFVRLGITPRNGDLVEKLAGVDRVVFDKTGTLGREEMDVMDFVVAPGFDRIGMRSLARALEIASDHPVAQALKEMGSPDDPMQPAAENIRIVPGAGIEGTVAGSAVRIGNSAILPESEMTAAASLASSAKRMGGATHEIYLVVDGRVAALAILREALREGASAAIRAFEAMGIEWEVMTGDREGAGEALGLRNVRAGLLPGDKSRMVRALRDAGHKVLFVGDGINDSAAMVDAHAAVALRSGTALAIESADAEISGSGLEALPAAVLQARRAVRAIRGNLLFAACYNALGIALAAGGFLHPVAAALIMLASSFTVTWRALREAEDEPARPPRRAFRFRPGWVAGVVGMILGMQAATGLASFLPDGNPGVNFFAGYGVMLFGMALGMSLACGLARKWVR